MRAAVLNRLRCESLYCSLCGVTTIRCSSCRPLEPQYSATNPASINYVFVVCWTDVVHRKKRTGDRGWVYNGLRIWLKLQLPGISRPLHCFKFIYLSLLNRVQGGHTSSGVEVWRWGQPQHTACEYTEQNIEEGWVCDEQGDYNMNV